MLGAANHAANGSLNSALPDVLMRSKSAHLNRQSMTMRWLGASSRNTPCTLPPYSENLPPCGSKQGMASRRSNTRNRTSKTCAVPPYSENLPLCKS